MTDQIMVFRATDANAVGYRLAPEKILAGAPEFRSWDLEFADDGRLVAGIWEATPGSWRSAKAGDWEFCHLIAGECDLTEDGKPPVRLRAGDSFVMRPDFVGSWTVHQTVRKSFVILHPAKG